MRKKPALPPKWEKRLNEESKEMFGKPVNRLNNKQAQQLADARGWARKRKTARHGMFWTPGI